MEQKSVIFVTDGDAAARRAVSVAGEKLGLPVLATCEGNPTTISKEEVMAGIKQERRQPILRMFDDAGAQGMGPGETLMKELYEREDIHLLGVLAVASTSKQYDWTNVQASVDRFRELSAYGVDKEGIPEIEVGRLKGDTVSCIDEFDVPIIGVGDIGKMGGWDDPDKASPITTHAIEILLERSGWK